MSYIIEDGFNAQQPTEGFGNSTPAPTETQAPATTDKAIKAKFDSVTATGVVLDNWRNAKLNYDKAKTELDERKSSVIQHIGEFLNVGTQRFSTTHFILKVVKTKKYDIKDPDMAQLNNALGLIAQACGTDVAMNLVQWTPKLNVKQYEALSEEQRKLIDPFITLSYNSPTLAVEEI